MTSTDGKSRSIETYLWQPELSPMRWIRLINFFPRFVPRRAHFSTQTFLSRAYEKASLRVREKDREPVESLIFFSFCRACLRRGPSGFRVCAGEPPFGHRHPPLCFAPRAPKWPTWHATGTKENFHLPPATETGSPSPAMLSRREKKRAEGLFLRREHVKIYVGSRLLTRSRFLHGGAERRGLR